MGGMAEEAWALGFGDLSVEDGFALREGTDWRHFPAADAGRYRGLLSIADLDAFLATDAARRPRISMADGNRKGSAAVPEEDYAGEDGSADLPCLFEAFDRGATLVVSQFNELHPALGRFCRGLEQVFLHAVQANIYLTPPGAQGFRMHYDTHDVLVLQVEAHLARPALPRPDAPHALGWRRGTAGGGGGDHHAPGRRALCPPRRAA